MRRSYGGIEIEVPSTVAIFEPDDARPVFHRLRDDVTLCGMLAVDRAVSLPAKHAVRFARPCARCWPRLSTLVSLTGSL